ncbi:hypothetical protein D910_12763 [Dendroctonus ponderosae]|uniref:Uncharacterized protein n=1 Tax=Dendroctonus ponderosae TaxID=77166 RepID=U4UYM8_DENPD|nr:hypothetical protein D910_12763 [Dendroctonus ponderosae]
MTLAYGCISAISLLISGSETPTESMNLDDLSRIFPTAPGLDDLGRLGMTLGAYDRDSCGSLEFCDYYATMQRRPEESGELTPVSHDSEMEHSDFSPPPDFDNTRTITSAMVDNCNSLRSNLGGYAGPIVPSSANVLLYSNDLEGRKVSNIKRAQSLYSRKTDDTIDIRDLVKDFDKEASNCNMANVGTKKWTTSKERFFDITKSDNIDLGRNLNTGTIKKVEKDRTDFTGNPGSILVREGYIEPPRVSKVSNSQLGAAGAFRRASDVPMRSKNLQDASTARQDEPWRGRPQFVTQMSQPCSETHRPSGSMPRKTSLTTELATRNARFTTTKVDEAEHAASVGSCQKRAATAHVPSLEPEMLFKRKNRDDATDCE